MGGQWEYKIYYLYWEELEDEFNRAGKAGWELVSILTKGDLNHCIFKRLKAETVTNLFKAEIDLIESGDYPK